MQKNLPDLNLQWLFVIRLLLLQVSSKILMLLEFVLPFLFYCLCGSENLKFKNMMLYLENYGPIIFQLNTSIWHHLQSEEKNLLKLIFTSFFPSSLFKNRINQYHNGIYGIYRSRTTIIPQIFNVIVISK